MLLAKLWAFGNKTWSDSTLILGFKVENLKFEEQSHFLNVLDFQVSSQQILMIVAVSVINKSSNPFKRYLGENAVYNFISNMIGESKYLSEVLRKRFNKTFGMTKQNNKDFKNSNKCWFYGNDYVDNDVKVQNHCHVTGQYKRFCT